jgi:hypothetical protein
LETQEKIDRLEKFKQSVKEWDTSWKDEERKKQLRTYLNQNQAWTRQQVIEAKCFHTLTIGPPPAVGGLIMRNVDPFLSMFDSPYEMDLTSQVVDMIDRTIGVLLNPPPEIQKMDEPTVTTEVVKNYAFIAMPIKPDDPELEDVLDSIKEACNRCGVQAERVDEPASNERITDRIIESIRKAEYVIVDLSQSKPNVFYEAGYAHGFGKIPIYIAKEGTKLEFDLKDYPVIFFKNMKQLKDLLEKELEVCHKLGKHNHRLQPPLVPRAAEAGGWLEHKGSGKVNSIR